MGGERNNAVRKPLGVGRRFLSGLPGRVALVVACASAAFAAPAAGATPASASGAAPSSSTTTTAPPTTTAPTGTTGAPTTTTGAPPPTTIPQSTSPSRETLPSPPEQRAPVAQGAGVTALAGGVALGATPAASLLSVSLVLRPRHLGQLEAKVERGFARPYLSVGQFAATYGQTPEVIDQLTGYLAGYGIASAVAPNRLEIKAAGSAVAFEFALGVALHQYLVVTPAPSPSQSATAGRPPSQIQVVHGTLAQPSLPSALAAKVSTVLGLTNAASFVSNATPSLSTRPVSASTRVQRLAGSAPSSQPPTQFLTRYNLAPLEAHGATGKGQTVGIVTLASVDPAVPQAYWTHYLHLGSAQRIWTVAVDGGAGAVSLSSGSDESTLDVEQAGAIAPGATIAVYQAPNTDQGFLDAWAAAINDDTASSISTSWGESETYVEAEVTRGQLSRAYLSSFDTLLLEAAAQGQSCFAATGDTGAYDANGDLGTKNLSVDVPAASRFVTAVGGTTLPGDQRYRNSRTHRSATVKVPIQRAWSWAYMWPLYQVLGAKGQSEASFAKANAYGGGGGYVASGPMPRYQSSVLGVRHYLALRLLIPEHRQKVDGMNLPTTWAVAKHPVLVRGRGTTRAVPDLSADADPQTGYQVYDPQFVPRFGSPVQTYGGTSFVAPQMAASAAVIDQYLGTRVGFWNPFIYRFASQPGSPFRPRDHTGAYNANLHFTGQAHKVYNAATGLGYPNLGVLAARFRQAIKGS